MAPRVRVERWEVLARLPSAARPARVPVRPVVMEEVLAEELDDEEQLARRHRKEKKELQAKIQGMKNAVPKNDKKRRKQLTEDVAKLEREMEQKHREELGQLQLTLKENKIDSVAVEVSDLVLENQPPRISKAQKRREKKAALEKEREERIAEAEIENLSGARHVESEKLAQILAARELEIKHIPSDGHCMYGALEDQLRAQDCALTVAALRKQTAEYMQSHSQDFLPFLINPDTGNMYTPEEFGKYCDDIVNTAAWGGQLELTLLNLGNNLLEEVPEELKYLTSLKKLHLFGNRICRFAAGICDGLQELILLNLNDNLLKSLPQEVGRLRNLTYLSLNHNQLTMIPRELCSLHKLCELHLNYNQLMCIPEEIKHLKNLQHLFLVRNNIEVLPEGLCHLKKLRLLDIAGNVIQIFPAGFQDLKLREFYCEGNPLFLKRPITAKQIQDIWTLREIAARFILHQLEENNQFIMKAIGYYPEVKDKISKARKCALCRKPFLSEWLECVRFVSPSKDWKISRNLQLIPLRILLCSFRCFKLRGPNDFGIAQE